MPILSVEELRLLETACADRRNDAARLLQNVFGSSAASAIMQQVVAAPPTVRGDLMAQVRLAIDDQKRRL